MELSAIILAGGQSTRMGSPKHLLPFPTNEPIFLDLLSRLRKSGVNIPCFISLRDVEQARAVERYTRQVNLEVILDNPAQGNIGPAAGLLAAHRQNPSAYWLVVACDYPLLPTRAFEMLLRDFEEPLTCFINTEGWCEPLLGIWSPIALRELEANVKAGRAGPVATVKNLSGKMLEPIEKWWLLNTNTPQQWHQAIAQRRAMNLEWFQ